MSLFEKCGDSALIAKKLGLSRSRVNRIIADYRAKHGLPKETMYASGVSDAALLRAHDETGQDVALTAKAVGLSYSQVHRRLTRIRLAGGSSARPHIFEADPASDKPNRVDGVRERAGVPLDAIRRVTGGTLREWGVAIKNKDGEFEEHGLYGTTLKFTVDTPEFPLIQPATPTKIVYNKVPRILRKVHQGLIISDAQIGYLRGIQSGLLDTIHDPRAMEVARQITGTIAPEFLGFIGDWVDFSWISRWTKQPEFFGIAQPSIQAGYEWKARFIAAAPQSARKMEIGSNHQVRPDKFVLEYNRESLGLTRARRPGDQGPEWHVFSEQFLCRYDELGVEFSGQYPGGEFFVTPDLALMHAPPKKSEFNASVIHGHTHKLGNATTHVTHDNAGRHEYATWDTGCLCRTDATTDKRRLMVTAVPSDRGRTDWLQGIIHFEWMEYGGGTKHQIHPIHIFDGHALYQGDSYDVAKDFDEGILANGYGYETKPSRVPVASPASRP
jgi:hypothetical protein